MEQENDRLVQNLCRFVVVKSELSRTEKLLIYR